MIGPSNGSPKRLSQGVFHQKIECDPPTNFHSDLIATTQQRCLLSVSALLSQQSHLFPICVVSTYNDSRKDLHRLCHVPRNQCNFFKLLDPLGGQVLHHDCKSMIVSRFTTFTENFVICDQVTRIFCTRYDSANTSSALVILVLWKISQFRSSGK